MQQLLDAQLAAALSQPIHISTDTQQEARENLFCLELTAEEIPLVTASDLVAWVLAIVAGKSQQLRQLRGTHYPMQFYCWHDALTAQLRFNLIAASAPLPFGCALRLVGLATIVQEFTNPEYLIFDENLLDPDSATGRLATVQAEAEEFILPIWRTEIP